MHLSFDEFVRHVPDARQRIQHLTERFTETYGSHPTVVASGPGRTEIIGNHTDHNHGRVVAAAIDQDALVVAGPSPDNDSHLVSAGWDATFRAPGDGGECSHDTERLMAGVAAGLRNYNHAAPAYQAAMDSRVTPGSGLSSSAALEVALAGTHAALAGTELDPVVAARSGQFAENHFMNKPSGLMDQMASAIGSAVAIDFADPESPRYHRLELDFRGHGQRLVVVNTGGSHADLTDQYAAVPREMHAVAQVLGVETLSRTNRRELLAHLDRVREATGDRAVLRAFHFFDEQDRVSALVDAVDSRLNERVLRAMNESGVSSWTLLQNVYAEGHVTEQPVALALEVTRTYLAARGALGACRVHGGGFAGTILAVIPEELVPEYHHVMSRGFGDGSVMELRIRPRGMMSADL